jgi:hypothetical protein
VAKPKLIRRVGAKYEEDKIAELEAQLAPLRPIVAAWHQFMDGHG